MQRLAFYSQAQIRALRDLHTLDYSRRPVSAAVPHEQEVERSAATRTMLTGLGVAHKLVSGEQARAIRVRAAPVTPLAERCTCRTTRPATAPSSPIS